MSRQFWIGLAAICVVTWTSLGAAFYLGRLKGRSDTMGLVEAYDAGLGAAKSGVRLCLRSDRTASGDATAKPSKTGNSGMKP